ncbi:hypothetical protein ACFE04_004652 [Oxalis oulophora]
MRLNVYTVHHFDKAVEKAKQLRKGSQMRKDWSNFPIDLDFKMFIFNVTNPDEVQNGGKPTVQEVGPYFYREKKGKTDLEDDPEEDTITYHMVNSWFFDKELSKPLTGNETIVIPHVVILQEIRLAHPGFIGSDNLINTSGGSSDPLYASTGKRSAKALRQHNQTNNDIEMTHDAS